MRTNPLRPLLVVLALAGVLRCAATATESPEAAAEACAVKAGEGQDWAAEGPAMELREVLQHGSRSVVALLDLWNGPNPAVGFAGLARQHPTLGSTLEALDACIATSNPSLKELKSSGLPLLVIRLLERHVRTGVLLQFLFEHRPEEVPRIIRESFPADQSFEYPEIVSLGLEYLPGSPDLVDAFVLGEVLPHINPNDVFHHTIFQAGHRLLSQTAQRELLEGLSPRVAFARGSEYRQLIAGAAGRTPEVARNQRSLKDTELRASLEELLDVLGRGVEDPSGLRRATPKLREWLWTLWSNVRTERANTQAILTRLRERSTVEPEERLTLTEMRLHSAKRPYSYAFFAQALTAVAGEGDPTHTFQYDLAGRWAPDDRYFIGFAARLAGPEDFTVEDLDLLAAVDVEKSSCLHALIVNTAAASARSPEGLDEDLARSLCEHLLNLTKAEWAAIQANDQEFGRGLPMRSSALRSIRRGRLSGSLAVTRFVRDRKFWVRRLSDEEYSAFLTQYFGLEDGAPLSF